MFCTSIEEAVDYASQNHDGQKRQSGENYINHPIRVMEHLERHGFDKEIQQAGVLHDVVEDTKVTFAEIERRFGPRVRILVQGVTKHRKGKEERDLFVAPELPDNWPIRADNGFMFYFHRLEQIGRQIDPGCLAIKASDQLDNLSDACTANSLLVERKVVEVEKFFLPLYRRSSEFFSDQDQPKFKALISELDAARQAAHDYLSVNGHRQAEISEYKKWMKVRYI